MTLVVYSLALIGMGFYFRRDTGNAAAFFLANRRLGAAEVGLALAGAGFGGSAILVASLLVYTRGLPGLWFTGSLALGFLTLGLFFAGRIRASGVHSLADFVALHYGETARRMVGVLVVVIEIAFFGLTVKSFSLLTTPLFGETAGWVGQPAVFNSLICLVFVSYTLLGGHKGIAANDFLQIALILAGFLGVLLPLSLARADFSLLPAHLLDFPFAPQAGPLFVLNMLALMGLPGIVGGDVFSKILSARDERAARRGALLAGVVMGTLALTVGLLALCARALLPGLENPELAIPELARRLLPGAMFHLISLAFLAALLSTADSVLMTGTTILTLDVLKLGNRASSASIRLLMLGLAAAGLAVTLYFTELLEIMKFGYTLLSASLVVPVIFTLATRPGRLGRGWVMAAMLAGLAAACAWKAAPVLWPGFRSPLDPAAVGASLSAALCAAGLLHARFRI